MKRKILLIIIIGFFLQTAAAAAKFNPGFKWSTLETEHFYVHYHKEAEPLARKAGGIAEDAFRRLSPKLGWTPAGKTHIVLADITDESNGYASSFPYNHMTIFLTQPVGDSGLGLMPYDDWLRLVITHELTHVLHLDMIGGVPMVLQKILGRIYFPNMFQPQWMIEGLATYEETEETAGGRGGSSGADMILRMAALEGFFPGLDEATVFPDRWPAQYVPYIFGESFTRYLVERFGRDKLAEISMTYSRRGVPFLVDSTGFMVLNRSYTDLWNDWLEHIKEKSLVTRRRVEAWGITPTKKLTEGGYLNINPVFSPDGEYIAYARADADGFPGLYLMKTDGTDNRRLVKNFFASSAPGSSLSWSPDGGRIYYTKLEFQDWSIYNDIYFYDVDKKRERRLTYRLRARDPHVSPDGKKLVFVTNRLAETRLAVMDLPQDGREIRDQSGITYITGESAIQYIGPRWSPDGSKIAVGVRRDGGSRDIIVLDAYGSFVAGVTHDQALDTSPSWSPEGKRVFFSSDRNGVFNIYAYDIETGLTNRLTNLVGGAFTPSPSPDGRKIVFSSYSAKGFDIHTIGMDAVSWIPSEEAGETIIEARGEKPVKSPSRPYSPLTTVLPRFWLPWYGHSSESGHMVGAFTWGQDVLQRHTYSFTGLYGPKENRVISSFDYFYDGLWPTLHLSASDLDREFTDFFTDSEEKEDYVERERAFSVSVSLDFPRLPSQQSVSLGYHYRRLDRLSDLPAWPVNDDQLPAEGDLTSVRLSYLFNNAKRYPYSISLEEGRTIRLSAEKFSEALGGDFNIEKYTADWHEYVNFPWKHHVLKLRAFAGASSGTLIPQRLFQLGGENYADEIIYPDEEPYYIRGYPDNVFRGRYAGLLSLEYRFPVWEIHKGRGSKPFYFKRVHGAVFAEGGNSWDDDLKMSEVKKSVGLEGRLDVIFGYQLPLTLRGVFAWGLDEGGALENYIGVWFLL